MDNNDIMNRLNQLINSIGAVAEISVLFFKSCLKSGASETEASALTKIFLETMIKNSENMETEK